jgi:hypothetical protein
LRITVVTGTRDATPEQLARLRDALDRAKPDLVIVGDCPDRWNKDDGRRMRSIDKATEDWCELKGVETMRGIARWLRRGKAAGPRRNHYLAAVAAALLKNECTVSFIKYPGKGTGTLDCVGRLQDMGIPEGES